MMRRWLPVILSTLILNAAPCAAFDYVGADRLSARLPAPGVAAMVARDDCLYLAGNGFLQVYDIGVTGDPILVATCAIPTGFTKALSVDGDYLFLQSSSQTLLVDLTMPRSPGVLAVVSGTGALALCRDRLLLGTSSRPRVYDLSDPLVPVELASLNVYGVLLGKLGGDLLTMSQHITTIDMIHELRLSRRSLTDSYALGDSAIVYSAFLSYEVYHSPGPLQKVADRMRLQLGWTYTDYGSRCRLGPCVSSGSSHWDLMDSDPRRRSGAQSILMSYPAGFLASGTRYDFGIVDPDGCTYQYLAGNPRADAPAGTSRFTLRSCTSGLACAADSRLFVAGAGVLRVYDFARGGRADTTQVYTYGPRTKLLLPSRAGTREAWLEEAYRCIGYSDPDGTWYSDMIERYLVVRDLDAGISPRYRPLVGSLYSTAFRAAALCDDSRYVVSEGNGSLRFFSLDGTEPYAVVDGVGAAHLLPVGPSLLAASGATLSVVDISDPEVPVPAGQIDLPGTVVKLFPTAGGAAVAGAGSGLTLLEPVTAGEWRIVTSLPSDAEVTAVESRGTQLKLSSGNSILSYDIGDPLAPVLVDSFTVMAPVSGFATSGSYVYAACGDAGLLVYERIAGAGAQYLGGYPYDFVWSVKIEDGRLLAATSHGLITLPLQDGDPLPAYIPGLFATVDDRGQTLLEWRAASMFGLTTRLLRVQDGDMIDLPFIAAGDRCLALDGNTVGLAEATYVLMARPEGMNWYEADRITVDLSARVTELLPAWPNPVNLATVIHYRLAAAGPVRLTIHDLAGRRVRRLVDGREDSGTRKAAWDGRDEAGRVVAAGLYLMRLEAGGSVRTRKLVVVR